MAPNIAVTFLFTKTNKTLKTGWRGVSAMSNFRKSTFLCILPRQPVLKVFFVSAPRFDVGESAICGLRAVRGKASRKPSTRKWQRALSPWRWHKAVFLVLVSLYTEKMIGKYRQHYFMRLCAILRDSDFRQ
jgi:hypothetical protein